MNNQAKALLDVLAGPIRVILLSVFLLLAKMGWFTWLTPQNYHDVVNSVMDALVVLVPACYALWVGVQAWRARLAAALANQPAELIRKTNDLPGVLGVAVTPALDARLPDLPTVTTPERLIAEIRKAS